MSHRGLEPRTTWLKVKCSTAWASGPSPTFRHFKCPEPESNQWHEDFQSSALPTELSGHVRLKSLVAGIGFEPMTFGLWARRASRLLHPALLNYFLSHYEKVMGRGGFEPPKQFAADLQSVPFGHSGISPYWSWWWDSNPQPADYKSAALPIEPHRHIQLYC